MEKESSVQRKRVRYLDLAGGILIIWVMVYHAMSTCKAFGPVDPRVALPLLTFSMPWFYYKSGQLFKGRTIKEGLKNDARKLVTPFLKWSLAGYALYLFYTIVIDGDISFKSCVTNPFGMLYKYGCMPMCIPAWFVMLLFFVRVISRYLLSKHVAPVIIIVAGIAIGYVLNLHDDPMIPYFCMNVSMGLVFFMIGNKYGRFEQNRYVIAACALGYVVFLATVPSIVGHHRNVLLSGYYLLWPVYAYCGIVVFNNVCRWIELSLSERAFGFLRPLTFVGESTMILLVSHGLIYLSIVRYSILDPWATVGLIVVAYVLLLTPLALYNYKKASKK